MKKVLLGTSAIALAGAAAAPASAAEWDVKVGGYALSYVVYMSSDQSNPIALPAQDRDGVDAWWDGEIHFKPSITLDNGIKIGADIQLEARAPGTPDIIDEAYTYVRGSFGEILIGDENSAGYKMHYGAPNRSGIGVNSPQSFFVPVTGFPGSGGDAFRGTFGSTYLENERNNDAGRITYFTPRFAGFQLGVSYARDATQNTAGFQNTNQTAASDIFDVGANYVNSFGGVDIAVSGRWGIATDNRTTAGGGCGAVVGDCGEDPTVLGFGATVGFGGFTIGGSWAEQNGAGRQDGTAYEVGIAYDTGPWGFSANYFHGENVDNESAGVGGVPTAAAAAAGQGVDETLDHYQLGVNYALAKGTNLNLVGGYVDFDEDFGAGVNNTGGNDVDGFYIGTGIRISF